MCAKSRVAPLMAVSRFCSNAVSGAKFFMAAGESLAHLMCLVHRGDLSMNYDADGVCYYQKVAKACKARRPAWPIKLKLPKIF